MCSTVRRAVEVLEDAVRTYSQVTSVATVVDEAAETVVQALKRGNKLFFCGNGGSAADAQHLAAEFLGRFLIERSPLPALALTANSSAITAIGNDYGYVHTFSRQLRGLAKEGDVIVGISTSGKSENVIEAFRAARAMNVRVIAMTGETESPMSELADVSIRVPSKLTPRIQEMHITVGHTICEIAEAMLANAE